MTEEQKPQEEKPVEEKPKETEKPKEEKKPKEPKAEAKPKKEGPAKVNYVHAALLLYSAGKEISESSLRKVVESAGVNVDDAQVKALVASLEGVNIEEAISQAMASPAPPPSQGEGKKKEEKKEEDVEKKAEEAAAGLSSLFG